MPKGKPMPYAYVCGHCKHLISHHLEWLPGNEKPYVCDECDCQIVQNDPAIYGIDRYDYERKFL